MSEFFTSLFDSYKTKIRNPFFATLFTVWLIRNWILVFGLFNFDAKYNMQNKLDFIADHFIKKDFWWEVGVNIFFTFILLVLTYIMLAGSRYLTDLYYKIIEPTIITKIDKSAILTVAEKTRFDKKIDSLSKKLIKSETELSNSEDQNKNIIEELRLIKKDIIETKDEYKHLQESSEIEIDDLNKEIKIYDLIGDEFSKTLMRIEATSIHWGKIDFTLENIINTTNYQEIFVTNGYLKSNSEGKLKLSTLGLTFIQYYENAKEHIKN